MQQCATTLKKILQLVPVQVGLFLFQIFRSQQHREAKTPKISWWVSADRAGGPVSAGSTWTDSTDTARPAVVSLVEFSGICARDRPKLDTTSLLVLLTTAGSTEDVTLPSQSLVTGILLLVCSSSIFPFLGQEEITPRGAGVEPKSLLIFIFFYQIPLGQRSSLDFVLSSKLGAFSRVTFNQQWNNTKPLMRHTGTRVGQGLPLEELIIMRYPVITIF